MNDLIKIRIISFSYSFGTLLILAVIGVLVSDDFSSLVKGNFGSGFAGTLILLLTQEFAKHLRNLAVTKQLGGDKKIILI